MLRTLIFTATYNENQNISAWVQGVTASIPDADLLVVDDSSPDGTGRTLEELARSYSRLSVVHRPGKAGLASAHLLAMDVALDRGYEQLITMDADGSHQPSQLPRLMEAAPKFDFLIGTRYRGGSHGAAPMRRILSFGANGLTRIILPTGLSEYTTSFRVFDRAALKVLVATEFTGGGYSFFLECVEALYRSGLRLGEVPIDFIDRTAGESKIPKSQIALSMQTLMVLGWRRWTRSSKFAAGPTI